MFFFFVFFFDKAIQGELIHFQGDNLVKIVFNPFKIGVYSKRKEFAPFFGRFFKKIGPLK